MSKKVLFEDEARQKLKKGVDTVADPVRVTMGPKGRAVIIPKGGPVFTLDGVTVAQAIDTLEDPVEDMGAQLVKNVAQVTNDEAGDGTTTASLLTQALVDEGLKGIAQGIDPIVLRNTFDMATKVVLDEVQSHVSPVENKEQMKAIATISARDPEIGDVIANIYDKIGKDGVIATEEVKTVGLDHEIVDGLQVDSGWASPYFMTNEDRGVAELENPYILVTDQNVRNNVEIANIMNAVLGTEQKSLLMIVGDIQGQAFATTVLNKLKGVMSVAVVKAPGFGDNKKDHLKDFCAVTGAQLISEELGTRTEDAELEHLGRADRVIVYKNRTIIVGGKGKREDIDSRISLIENELKETESRYSIDNLTKRLAKVKGGVAVIRVGDVTEEASREKQYRIEDAVNATKSAIEEGVVTGGGMALYKAANVLDSMVEKEKDIEIRFGLQAVARAIRKPARQILENQGENADVVLAGDYHLPREVIDPFKVERVALQQSTSMVGLFLITNAVVFEKPEEDKKK